MNFVEEGEFSLTEDVSDIERRFCKFYFNLINEYFNLDNKSICTEKEILIRRTYKKKNYYVIKQAHQLLLSCVQDTCLGLRKFYATFMKYKEIVKYLSKKSPLVIYCVIGESILAALGICIVIDEAVEKCRRLSTKMETKQIQIIATGKDQNWKTLFSSIVERVNSCYKNIKIELVIFDACPDRLPRKVVHAVKEADIVVMSRYFSQFESLKERGLSLEVILSKMKELSIFFYLDACHKSCQDTVKHVFRNTDSFVEIRSKKTTFQSLQVPRNGDHIPEFPFLSNASFEKVMYSIWIKDTKDDLSLLKHSRKQMQRKISERYAKENLLLSKLKASHRVNCVVNKKNAKVFKRKEIVGNSISRNFEKNNKCIKVKKSKAETAKTRKVVVKKTVSNLQNKKACKCLPLEIDEPILDYAAFLSEMYYSKYFDKEIPGSSKIKSYKRMKNGMIKPGSK